MARLNVYLNDEIKNLAEKWRDHVNLSQVCTDALKRELEALEFHRALGSVLAPLKPSDPLERKLVHSYGLKEAFVIPAESHTDIREELGQFGAKYLNYSLSDDTHLAVAGGRQIWCVVRNLTPRQASISITAIGIGQSDPRILHAHPNTIATILWLLFSPRATANIIHGTSQNPWKIDPKVTDHPRYFVLGSCAPFDGKSTLSPLLGKDSTDSLIKKGASGDFLYHFFDRKGNILDVSLSRESRILRADLLRQMARRKDARIVLIAGGYEKRNIVHLTLKSKLCNVLITDSVTAEWLVRR